MRQLGQSAALGAQNVTNPRLPAQRFSSNRCDVPRIVRTFLTFVCALYLSGAHWAVLQVTAWTGMLVTRAPEAGLLMAIGTTFDGEHPCRMCEAVADGQKEEREQQPLPRGLGKLKDLKLLAMTLCVVPPRAPGCEMVWAELAQLAARRLDAPPTPPPLA